ncbi:MAG: toxin-antitoxin system YwqK family antitoxin [Bacteroidales bacterium]|nr:toxin-antitoxin system YwqK family antitoxin [Bacteroidales bacterium]
MKKVVYYLMILFFFASCSHKGIVITENELPEEIFYLPDQIKPYTGRCIMHYNNTGIIKQEMTFRNGKLDGEFITYYKDGSINRKGEFIDGRYNGKWEQWAENGKKLYEVHYKNDSLCGDFRIWYSTGVLKQKGVYAENTRSGLWIEYDEAGMIIRKKNYN